MLLKSGMVAAGALPLPALVRDPSEEQGELESLRLANAQLMREVAALKEREARAQRLADRDDLTGLYNRRCLQELLQQAINEGAQKRQCVGLLFIDMNGFKGINDEYGHAAGDKVLVSVATRVSARVRAGDVVCRYGGDEFVVVLPNVPDAAAVAEVADAIRNRVALPYWIEGNEQHLTAAIGESIYPHDGENAATLLDRADQAMYRRKMRHGRSIVSVGNMVQPRHSRRRTDKADPHTT
jgi:diguanylate cyclase